MLKINKHFGFTLAEVLVTLGIIGVVSAMTIPSLVKNYQRQVYVTQLRKVYNEVGQAVQTFMTDNRLVSMSESRLIGNKTALENFVNNYFKIANMGNIAQELDQWIRRRIRMCYWKQWKKIKTKHDNLVKLGIENYKAWEFANTRKSYWRISKSPILSRSLNNKTLERLGYLSLSSVYC